jgi:formylmethanofuran dehydrogenase subunit E-like metal-binding protein
MGDLEMTAANHTRMLEQMAATEFADAMLLIAWAIGHCDQMLKRLGVGRKP